MPSTEREQRFPVSLTIDGNPLRVWTTQPELDKLDALPASPPPGRTVTAIRLWLAGLYEQGVNIPAGRIAPRR